MHGLQDRRDREFIGSQDGLSLLNKARLVFVMKEVFYILLFILLTVLFQGLVELVYATFLSTPMKTDPSTPDRAGS